jgi:hypothetical protein
MEPLSIVIAQASVPAAAALAARLRPAARSLTVAPAPDALPAVVARHRARLAVVDLECASLQQVEALHREFPALAIVCTHRLADEVMWAQALAAGAIDCCQALDAEGILQAARRNLTGARGTAA